jgi:hypothetical protein
MHVLIYVITFLMILAVLTGYRIDSARSTAGLHVAYLQYMETIERAPINAFAKIWYDRFSIKSYNKGEQSPTHTPGTSRLSLYLLVDKNQREAAAETYQQTRELAKRLMKLLYQNAPEFKEVLEKRPRLFDEILDEIVSAADQLPPEKKITHVADLISLPFSSQDTHYILFLMLNGQPAAALSSTTTPIEEINDTDDEGDAFVESNQSHAKPGYISLQNFLSMDPTSQLRVYLAHPLLLEAIFKDAATVERIRLMRIDLYRSLKKKSGSDVGAATVAFQGAFSSLAPEFPAILNYTVTHTDPRKYEKLIMPHDNKK